MKNSQKISKEHVYATTNPFFSVVITTYNRSLLIIRALGSLIKQTEVDWEAVIIDDGSTDNTYENIFFYLSAYPKIKYLYIKHRGAVKAKNKGIKASSGKYVTFLDSDDEYHPRHLEYRKRILLKDPQIRFIYGGAKITGNQYVPDKTDPSKIIHLDKCVIGGTFVIERNTMVSLKGFREIMPGSDADLYERAIKHKIPMKECKLPTYIYHHENPDSITNQMFEKIK